MRVSRWAVWRYRWWLRRHPRPPGKTEAILSAFSEASTVLAETMTSEGIAQWMGARNPLLDGRTPMQEMVYGDPARVVAAAQSFTEGSYI